MIKDDSLSGNLSEYYSNFKVKERVLLTGHSHQAWPDVAEKGLKECWNDAAEFVDLKWERAFQKADILRSWFAELMNDNTGLYSLSSNTHDLIIKFLSSLDLRKKPKLITTDMEFHTIRRQLDRLVEENLEIVKVSSYPVETLSERIIKEIDNRTSAVLCSKVFYKNGRIVENLGDIEIKCSKFGAYLLVDAYHALNVIDFDIETEGITNSFIVGGGYKYCQLGEGNCFLRIPANVELRPVITGWFSEFNKLAEVKHPGEVAYGKGHFRFAGSTYDPVSHYRAAEVIKFFKEMELTPKLLREINLRQIKLMIDTFDKLNFDKSKIYRNSEIPIEKSGGFLVLITKYADLINKSLFKSNIYTDYREDHLRLGPAPYISDNQLIFAIESLSEIVNKIGN